MGWNCCKMKHFGTDRDITNIQNCGALTIKYPSKKIVPPVIILGFQFAGKLQSISKKAKFVRYFLETISLIGNFLSIIYTTYLETCICNLSYRRYSKYF